VARDRRRPLQVRRRSHPLRRPLLPVVHTSPTTAISWPCATTGPGREVTQLPARGGEEPAVGRDAHDRLGTQTVTSSASVTFRLALALASGRRSSAVQ